MIVRIFRVVVYPERRADFEDFFLNTALPLMHSQPGLVTLVAGLPRPETPDEFSLVMVWKDVDALRDFAGEDWREPHVHPSEEGLVRERHLHHYELAAA